MTYDISFRVIGGGGGGEPEPEQHTLEPGHTVDPCNHTLHFHWADPAWIGFYVAVVGAIGLIIAAWIGLRARGKNK